MLLSRRSTLTYGSAIAALASAPLPAVARTAADARASSDSTQLVQHLVIHPDACDGNAYCATFALAAPDTAWRTGGLLTDRGLRAAMSSNGARGYGLRRVNAFQTRDGMRYAAIWQLGAAAPSLQRHGLTRAQFRAAASRFAADGHAIAHFDATATDSGVRFAALWEKSAAPQHVVTDLTEAEYTAKRAALAAEGFTPRQIAGYTVNGETRFAALFDKSAAARQDFASVYAAHFATHARAMRAEGYTLIDAAGYVTRGLPHYTTVWQST